VSTGAGQPRVPVQPDPQRTCWFRETRG
jgi:hypothetical protein